MNGGIEDILRKYGTSLSETRSMLSELMPALKQRRQKSQYPFLETTQYLTAFEAKEYGIGLEEGWMLKIVPGAGGTEPTVSYITPEKWEIFEDQSVISPQGRRFSPEEAIRLTEFAPEVAQAFPQYEAPIFMPRELQALREVFPDEDLSNFLASMTITEDMPVPERLRAERETEEFFNILLGTGRTPETEYILRWLGATTEEIDTFFATVPEITPAGLEPKTREEREYLLRDRYRTLSDEAIENFFALDGSRESVTVWATKNAVAVNPILAMALKENPYLSFRQIEEALGPQIDYLIKLQTGIFPPPSTVEQAARSFSMGIADIFSGLGGIAGWAGLEDVQEYITDATASAQRQYLAQMPLSLSKEFEWSDLLDVNFYATKVTRTVPFALSLVPLAIAGFIGGSALAGAIGLGRLATWLVGSFTGAALSRPAESALEAGEAYNYAIAQGLTQEEASKAFKDVFTQNMALAGWDAVEIAVMFAPTPSWVPKRLVRLGLVRTITVGGKMFIVGLSEGGEEIYQDIIQRKARGEEWHWDAVSKEVFVIGSVMGLGMGLAGDVITVAMERVRKTLPDEQLQKLDDRVSELQKEGVPEQAAQLQALEELAATDTVVSETVKQAIIREQASQQEIASQITEYLDSLHYSEIGVTERIAEIEALLREKGKLPTGEGTRAEVANELARLEALNNLASMHTMLALDNAIETVQNELGNRSMPFHGGTRNIFPEYTTAQLEEQLRVYEEAKAKVQTVTEPWITPPRSLEWEETGRTSSAIESLEILYNDLQTEIKAFQAALKGLTGNEALAARANLTRLQRQLNYVKKTLTSFKAKPTTTQAVTRGVPSQELREQNVDRIINKLITLIETAKPARAMTEAIKGEELSKRVGAVAAILEKGGGRKAFYQAKAKLRGELPTAEFTPPESNMTEEDIEALFDWVEVADLPIFNKGPLTRVSVGEALETLLSGNMPTEGQLQLLEGAFGSDLVKAILAKRPLGKKIWTAILNLINLPRAVQTAYDWSGLMRQGALLAWGHPMVSLSSIWAMARGTFSARIAEAILQEIETSKYALLREKAGLELTPLHGAARGLPAREEPYMTEWARYIPGVAQSEQAYIVVLNKLRAGVFDKYAALWEGRGYDMQVYKDLATWINLATGRGPIGKLRALTPLFNAVFYSARLQSSRIVFPFRIFTFKGPVRAAAFRSTAAFIGATLTIMAILKWRFPDEVDIELDPRSPDFLKIRIGDVRLDPWTGFQQYVRYLAQIVTGYAVTSTGREYQINRWDRLMRLVRSKEAPVMGLIHDILTGESFIGEEISTAPESVRHQVYNRLTPLFVQDLIEAFNTDGWFGAFTATPGFWGWGVVSYPDPLQVIESQLGEIIDESVLDPEAGEAIYDMVKFGQDINGLTRGMTAEEVEAEGHSPLVIAYARMREWREKYQAFSDKESDSYIEDEDARREARKKFLRDNPEANAMMAVWGIPGVDFETREAWDIAQQMFKDLGVPENAIPESNVPADAVDAYFDYQEAVEQYGANSAEAMAIRAANPAFERWGEETRGWQPVETPSEVAEISIKWREQDEQYDALETTEEREAFLEANPEYAIARLQRDAYNFGFAEELIDTYVEYYQLPGKEGDSWYEQHPSEVYYEDDWFLLEHPEFYQAALELKGWSPRDFSKVPTRAVWDLYKAWVNLPLGKARREFEAANPILDYWLHIVRGTKVENDLGIEWLEEHREEIFAGVSVSPEVEKILNSFFELWQVSLSAQEYFRSIKIVTTGGDRPYYDRSSKAVVISQALFDDIVNNPSIMNMIAVAHEMGHAFWDTLSEKTKDEFKELLNSPQYADFAKYIKDLRPIGEEAYAILFSSLPMKEIPPEFQRFFPLGIAR